METLEKYFTKKRERELSSKSNDGEASKKLKEDEPAEINTSVASDVSVCNEAVFDGGLDSTTCKDILFECLKDLDRQIKEIRGFFLESKENQIKGTEQLTSLAESVKHINEVFDSYEIERTENKKTIKELQENNSILSKQVKQLEEKADRQEQYSRRNCLLIHGVKEQKDEDTNDVVLQILKDELKEEVHIQDLDRTHRIGKESTERARPIIVKFARYNVRKIIFKNKRKLKGKKISITESLTKLRISKLNEARDTYNRSNVWTYDGRIMVKDDNNKIRVYYD